MEININYEIWELDRNHGLKPAEDYSSYQRNTKDRIVLLEPSEITQTHDSFNAAIREIEDKGKTYTEYTILPRIYKTN